MSVSKLTALAILLSGVAWQTSAATAEVTWSNVDNYSDIRAANENQQKFEQRIKDRLTEHFQELAAKLPESQKLTVNVTNLDLVGRVEPTYGHSGAGELRIVKRVDFPKINFTYALADAQGNQVSGGDVVLKDMGFDFGSAQARISRDDLYFEKRMIDEWFQKNLQQG